MRIDPEVPDRRQSHCPTCDVRVIPTKMVAGIGIVVITNRCDACGQEWTAEYSVDEIQRQRATASKITT